jgi:hypothetical protein
MLLQALSQENRKLVITPNPTLHSTKSAVYENILCFSEYHHRTMLQRKLYPHDDIINANTARQLLFARTPDCPGLRPYAGAPPHTTRPPPFSRPRVSHTPHRRRAPATCAPATAANNAPARNTGCIQPRVRLAHSPAGDGGGGKAPPRRASPAAGCVGAG